MKSATRFAIVLLLAVVALTGCSRSGGGETAKEDAVADRHMQRGVECLQSGELDCAVKELEMAGDRHATSDAFNYLGMTYRMKYNNTALGEWKDKEIEAFKRAIELDDQNVIAVKNLGATYYYMGEKAKAADLFERALELNPYDPEKYELEKMIAEGR